MVPDSHVYATEIFFNLNSKGMKILNFSLKGPMTVKIFRNETLFIDDYENVPKFVFHWLPAKVWLKEALACGMITLLKNEFG